jgi:uncharacterized protein (UPF0548 family)
VLRLSQPRGADLDRLLEQSRQATPSYPEVGATRSGSLPAGYRLDRYERRLGSDPGVYEKAVSALRNWQGHIGARVRVYPDGAVVEPDSTVLFVLRAIGLWTIAPCRVVYVESEPSRFAFAYGTLPGHPERGEVAMTIRRDDPGAVTACIQSFSRTVDPFARAGLPATRLIQKRITARYLEALAQVADSRND